MFQLQITDCHRDQIDALNELLEATSALSITLTDQYDEAILEPELGTTPLWPDIIVHALYPGENEAQLALAIVSFTFPQLNYTLALLPEQDWERTCLKAFKPQRFGKRLWICPSWLTPPEPRAVNLILDPGLAFGTGTHPTTSLCLTWLEQADLKGKTLIDYGCGSGILALAALKLGAAHVSAVDIDEQALIATRNNAENNGLLSPQLTIGFPEILTAKADILIANILLTPLIQLQSYFYELIKPRGVLVISGILENQVSDITITYQSLYQSITVITQDEWALIHWIAA